MQKLQSIYFWAGLSFVIPPLIIIFELVFVLADHISFPRYLLSIALIVLLAAPSITGILYVILGQYKKAESRKLSKLYKESLTDEEQYKDDIISIISEKLDYYDSDEDKAKFMAFAMSEIELLYYPKKTVKASVDDKAK